MMYEEEKKENRRKINEYLLSGTDGAVDFYPAYIQLEQTNRCNAECIMCNHFFIGNKGAQDIGAEVIEKMKTAFPYCETLMLNGDGEPFFSKNIVEQIREYKSYGMKIGTNTNLCFIPDDCWTLFEDGFGFLNISCDGASKVVFEMIRRGLSFDKFMHNLEKLCETAPDLRRNLDCVIMRENIHEAVEIVDLAYRYGFKSVRFNRMGVNPCIGNHYDADAEFERFAAFKLREAKEYAESKGIRIQIPNYSSSIELVDDIEFDAAYFSSIIDERQKAAKEKFKDLSLDVDYFSSQVTDEDFNNQWYCGKHCQWALERCYVDLKGNVSTCCFNMKKKIGNLYDKSFEDIWNGEEYKRLRRMMAEHYLPIFCKSCNWIIESKF